jgi:hypothetical protein
MAAHPWTDTPLGPIESWPTALRTLVELMLDSRQPMFIAREPEQTWLYNVVFIPIAGRKHPGCLGLPAREVWAEAWTDLKPLFDQVWSGKHISPSLTHPPRRTTVASPVFLASASK